MILFLHIAGLSLAQTLAQSPNLVTKIQSLITTFQAIGTPLATLSLLIGIGMLMLGKALPGAVQEQRGTIMSILMLVFIFGMVPTLVNWLYTLGSTP